MYHHQPHRFRRKDSLFKLKQSITSVEVVVFEITTGDISPDSLACVTNIGIPGWAAQVRFQILFGKTPSGP